MKKTVLLALALIAMQGLMAQTIRYVKETGSGDGSSWNNASNDLQAMIDAVSTDPNGGEVWVAQGTYYPSKTNNRDDFFRIKANNIKLYGGFEGTTETSISQRDIVNNKTILSGDIGTANNLTDNSYHIMAIAYDENASVHNPIDNSTVIDGFEFTSGNANSGSVTNDGLYPRFSGSAVFITSWGEEVNITPTISNCTFMNNRAFQSGAIYCDAAATSSNRLKISGCRFENNYAEYEGAAINLFNLADAGYEGVSGTYSAEINGCTFVNNSVNNASQGGANGGIGAAIMAFGQGNTTITGCVFDNNQSTNYGSAIAMRKNATVSVNNSLFYTTENGAFVLVYNNQSNLQLLNSTLYSQYGGVLQIDGTTAFDLSNSILWTDASGTNVITAADANGEVTNCLINSIYSAPNMLTTSVINQNPLFTDVSADNYTLQAGSPAINAGNNGLYAGLDASTTDLAGNPR